ncbi:MAG: hypothetical protein QMC95_13460 [Desulfitobacteriaceae bacterium]|nr:hypothetical protein [Desulfitobacteriaceae bacterium]MDI6915206.1 hypothetical protein [Desulfitobacteriaceae bacterium]
MKKVFGYWIYTLFVGILVFWGFKQGQTLSIQVSQTLRPYSFYFFMAYYPIVIGLLLGIPELISHVRREGKWRIDWQKIFGIVVPTLLVNMSALLITSSASKYLGNWYSVILDKQVLSISGLVCGYMLSSSFEKVAPDGND